MSGFGLWMAPHSPLANGKGDSASIWEGDLLRSTPSLRHLIGSLVRATADDVPVLLTGELGTGKSHLAQLIHEHSPRKASPLRVVSCSALAQGEPAREVCGHVQAAGTEPDQIGKVGQAGAGTLLLKEVDALGLEQQAQVLRLLENGKCEAVIGRRAQPDRVRVIASSKLDLKEAVAQGKFRSDLHDRLRGLSLHLPPLRERRADIGPLVRELMAQFGKELGKGLLSLDPSALAIFEAFPWPGNIRQLRNVVHQAVLASPGPELSRWDLPLGVREWAASPRGSVPVSRGGGFLFRTLCFLL